MRKQMKDQIVTKFHSEQFASVSKNSKKNMTVSGRRK